MANLLNLFHAFNRSMVKLHMIRALERQKQAIVGWLADGKTWKTYEDAILCVATKGGGIIIAPDGAKSVVTLNGGSIEVEALE